MPGEAGHVSRYQSFRFQKSLSQPLRVALSLFDIAATQRRLTIGITATSSTIMSFILTNSAARLIGSSSPWAALKILSYSSLRQRVGLMPCHLLSFDANLPRHELLHETFRVGHRRRAGRVH